MQLQPIFYTRKTNAAARSCAFAQLASAGVQAEATKQFSGRYGTTDLHEKFHIRETLSFTFDYVCAPSITDVNTDSISSRPTGVCLSVERSSMRDAAMLPPLSGTHGLSVRSFREQCAFKIIYINIIKPVNTVNLCVKAIITCYIHK